jgi:hypothetical protein
LHSIFKFKLKRLNYGERRTWLQGAKLRYYGWGEGRSCELVLLDQKGVAEVVPDGRTLQSLIDLSFPKIVGEPQRT